jgi:hypothetical protein
LIIKGGGISVAYAYAAAEDRLEVINDEDNDDDEGGR